MKNRRPRMLGSAGLGGGKGLLSGLLCALCCALVLAGCDRAGSAPGGAPWQPLSPSLDKHGYLVDIVEIEAALNNTVGYFRDSMLNEKPEFAGLNPSIEHFSRIICEKLLAQTFPGRPRAEQ